MNSYRLNKTEEHIKKIIVNRSAGKLNAVPVAREIIENFPVLQMRINEIIDILGKNSTFVEKIDQIMKYVENDKYWIVTVCEELKVPINNTYYHHGPLSLLLKKLNDSRPDHRKIAIVWSQEISYEEYLQYKEQ